MTMRWTKDLWIIWVYDQRKVCEPHASTNDLWITWICNQLTIREPQVSWTKSKKGFTVKTMVHSSTSTSLNSEQTVLRAFRSTSAARVSKTVFCIDPDSNLGLDLGGEPAPPFSYGHSFGTIHLAIVLNQTEIQFHVFVTLWVHWKARPV